MYSNWKEHSLPTHNFIPLDKQILRRLLWCCASNNKAGQATYSTGCTEDRQAPFLEKLLKKSSLVPPSYDTISTRIDGVSDDILVQEVENLVTSLTKFSINSMRPLTFLIWANSIYFWIISKEVRSSKSFCSASLSQQRRRQLTWRNLWTTTAEAMIYCGTLCLQFARTRAPTMLGGGESCFGAPVTGDAPHLVVTHSVLHKHALA